MHVKQVGCNLLGISLTLSSQAAFCVQLTTIIVPLAQAAMGVKLKPQIWAAVAMAFAGTYTQLCYIYEYISNSVLQ
jgi:drug/metabolite transporter (DMT)-like permease